MSTNSPTCPTQPDVDSIASFVLAAAELRDEPFFSKDEPRTISSMGTKYQSFHLGDRFHFRSALITFRRVWLKGDAENFDHVCNILWKYLPAGPRDILESFRESVNQMKRSEVTFPQIDSVSGEQLIDLWLHAVFAHSGLRKDGQSRKEFDRLVEQFGHGVIEYAFRHLVWCIGLQFLNVSQLARQLLEEWQTTFSAVPSFVMRAPFGTKQRERTPEGHLIIRKSSSEYFSEESFEQRFSRVLKRQRFRNLKSVFDQLNFPGSELARQVLKHQSIAALIAESEMDLRVVDVMPEQPDTGGDFRFFCGLWDQNTGRVSRLQCSETDVVTDLGGVEILDGLLGAFRAEFLQ